jgi:glycosyltransferase involved in cell wall biosynthesis
MNSGTGQAVRVLFLAWGDSIHARRRIEIFTKDPGFEVAVVSTFDYQFANARNYRLAEAMPRLPETEQRASLGRRILRQLFIFIEAFRIFHKSGLSSGADRWGRFLALVISGFRSTNVRCEMQTAVRDFRSLEQAVAEFRPDVIFLQTLLYPCYLAYLLPSSIPVVVTFWNGDLTWWAQWRGAERLLKKEMVTYGVRCADAITVNSNAALDVCINYGAPREKIHLIRYPGVDLERFRPASRETAQINLGIKHGKVILCPRGIGGYLNSDVIIEAAAVVVSKISEVLFLFISGAGGDVEWQRHMDRAKELGIADNVRRDGQIPWERMPLYYQAADAVVSVSSNDSLPNCMVEAMSCGIPLVMGDIPQIREWVTDGVNGLLVPCRDPDALAHALLRLLADNGTLPMAFACYNLGLVGREFDSRKNSLLIKRLVQEIVGKHIYERRI